MAGKAPTADDSPRRQTDPPYCALARGKNGVPGPARRVRRAGRPLSPAPNEANIPAGGPCSHRLDYRWECGTLNGACRVLPRSDRLVFGLSGSRSTVAPVLSGFLSSLNRRHGFLAATRQGGPALFCAPVGPGRPASPKSGGIGGFRPMKRVDSCRPLVTMLGSPGG